MFDIIEAQGAQLSDEEKKQLNVEMTKIVQNYFNDIINYNPFSLTQIVTLQNLTNLALLLTVYMVSS